MCKVIQLPHLKSSFKKELDMCKIRLFIFAKTSNPETGRIFETTLYKDVELPFLPTLDLSISFDDLTAVPPIKSIVWNASGDYFVCKCADEIQPEIIGKNEKYKWHSTFINEEYKDKGWIVFEVEDED